MLVKREFNYLAAKEKICNSGLRPLIPEDFLPRLVQLLNKCWEDKPSKRPSADSVCTELKSFEFGDFLSGVRTSREITNLLDSINNQIEQARMFRGRNPETVVESEASTRMKEKEMLDNLKMIQKRLSSLTLIDDALEQMNTDNENSTSDADTLSMSPREEFISVSPRMKSLPAIPTDKVRLTQSLSASPPTSERKIPSKISTEIAIDREMSPRQYLMQQQHQQLLQQGQVSPRSKSPFRPTSPAPNRPTSPRDFDAPSITISKIRPPIERPTSSPARTFASHNIPIPNLPNLPNNNNHSTKNGLSNSNG